MDPLTPDTFPALQNPAGVIPFVFPGVPHIRCAFSTSPAGSMSLNPPLSAEEAEKVKESRLRLAADLGISRWAELHQVHGDTVIADVSPSSFNEAAVREADGSCTKEKGLALVVKTADCQPILLADKEGKAVCGLHVGWRGNRMNFPASGLKAFCGAYGLAPKDIVAVRGPSLGPGAAEFINFDKEWGPDYLPWFDTRRQTMNLWELTRAQLIEAGVPNGQIYSLDLCTWSLPNQFFSHRRGHAGRQVSLIWKTK